MLIIFIALKLSIVDIKLGGKKVSDKQSWGHSDYPLITGGL